CGQERHRQGGGSRRFCPCSQTIAKPIIFSKQLLCENMGKVHFPTEWRAAPYRESVFGIEQIKKTLSTIMTAWQRRMRR
ncbi:MAG: hypothetical protein LH479_06580, partial [Polaromonas sp.]|nr:hypothetical protein [Polaromonas sp.]